MRSGRMRHLWLAALGGASLFGSHWLTYALATPDPAERTELLHSSGHAYWPYAVAVAVTAVALVVIAGLAGTLRSMALRRGPRRLAISYAARRLTTLQVAGFVALEALEALASGGIHAHIWVERPFALGVAVQLLTALLVAALLVAANRALARIVGATGPLPAPSASATWTPAAALLGPHLVPTRTITARGPPSGA